jgi:hypothetical protein
MSVKRFIHIPVLLSLISLIWIGCDPDSNLISGSPSFVAEEPFSSSIGVIRHERIRLAAVTGMIHMIGRSSTDVISISGKKKVTSTSTADAESHLSDITINIQDLGSEVFISTNQPGESGNRLYQVDYTIIFPDTLATEVGAVIGKITIDSIIADVGVNHVTGNVLLNGLIGNSSVVVVTGNIEGDVTLHENGDLDWDVVTGNIDLEIPVNTSALFTANVTTGNINVENLSLQNISGTPTFLNGTLGSGKGNITLTVMTGNIDVTGIQ